MSWRTIWNEPLGMLLASGSPGSALAYELGVAHSEAIMMRRSIATDDSPEAKPEAPEPGFGDAFFHRARTLR